MLQVERECEVIQSLRPADQARMAALALNGWRFSLRAAGTWRADHVDYFDQYGVSLESCLDQVAASSSRRQTGVEVRSYDRR